MGVAEPSSLAQRFVAVAKERVARIRQQLGAIHAPDGGPADDGELRREAHTLKGEARVLGFGRVGDAAHAFEELLVPGWTHDGAQLGIVARALDEIDDVLATAFEPADDARDGAPSSALDRIARLAGDAYLRVDLEALAALARTIGELRVDELELGRLVDELEVVSSRADELDVARDVRTSLRRTLSRAKQLAFDEHHRLEQLNDRLRAIRMVPLGTLLEPFPRATRELATALGKAASVEIRGASVEVDRQVLDVIADPLVHLVRNAVDHGIEAPDVRHAAGKDPAGVLRISARSSGSVVTIEVEDDGAGVDVRALRDALSVRGESADEALDDAAILDRLCRHGLSTRAHASDVSGRGVGLDVVKRRVESVGGRLTLRTRAGEGTRFTLEVPMSSLLATLVSAVLDGVRYGLSAHEVAQICDVRELAVEPLGSGLAVRIEERPVPFVDLAALLHERGRDPRERASAMVLVLGERRLAVAVDRVVGTAPVLQQRLDPFLDRARAVRSTAVLASGGIAIALDVQELFRRADQTAADGVRAPALARGPAPASRARVLVVDDSELTRDVIVSTLREMGLDVLEAVNGQRAIELLSATSVDLVVTDLDMPMVDGFELLRRLRATPGASTLPVIVLSTRGGPADIARASELGADAYLTKSRLELDELRRVVASQLETRSA